MGKTLLEKLRDATTDAERQRLIEKLKKLDPSQLQVPPPIKRNPSDEPNDSE